MRRIVALAAVTLCCAALLAGCGVYVNTTVVIATPEQAAAAQPAPPAPAVRMAAFGGQSAPDRHSVGRGRTPPHLTGNGCLPGCAPT